MDGELFMGKGSLSILLEVYQSPEHDWSMVRYIVYDLPGSQDPIEVRLQKMRELSFPSHVMAAQYRKCEGEIMLRTQLRDIIRDGGEGILAIRPDSYYAKGRSNNLLRVKVFFGLY
jgi:DNA ligase-1